MLYIIYCIINQSLSEHVQGLHVMIWYHEIWREACGQSRERATLEGNGYFIRSDAQMNQMSVWVSYHFMFCFNDIQYDPSTTYIHCYVLCIATVSSTSSTTSINSTCQSVSLQSLLRFCLGNSLSNGSSYYDLMMHIWFLIDTTAIIEYGETLGIQIIQFGTPLVAQWRLHLGTASGYQVSNWNHTVQLQS